MGSKRTTGTNDVSSDADGLVRVQPTAVEGVWQLLLNRPPANAMSMAMYKAVMEALDALEKREDLACLLIGSASEGRFCAGADTKELAALTHEGYSMQLWEEREATARAFVTKVGDFAYPTIAVIDGYAIGAGFVLASQCDIRIASNRAWFTIPELDVSRLGGAVHALRVLPQGIVRSMYFQGTRLEADKAASIGFINEIVAPEALWNTAIDAGREVARRLPRSLRMAKRALNLGQSESIETGYELERLYSFRLAAAERADGSPQ
jgi:enoyl-CoA hydratase